MRVRLKDIIPEKEKIPKSQVKIKIKPVLKEGFYVREDYFLDLIRKIKEVSVKLYAKMYFEFLVKVINDHELTGSYARLTRLFNEIKYILLDEELTDAQKVSSIVGISEEKLVVKLAASYKEHSIDCDKSLNFCDKCEIESFIDVKRKERLFEDTFELVSEFKREKVHISEEVDSQRLETLHKKLREVFSSEIFVKNARIMKEQIEELVGDNEKQFMSNIIAARIDYAKIQKDSF